MRFLCIDTSGGTSIALTQAEAARPLLSRGQAADTRRHAESLSPLIKQVVMDAGFSTVAEAQIDAIAVGVGPAPFTGLRSGIVTARTMGRALGAEVYGICSLDMIARQTLDLLPEGDQVMVVADARRKEVYVAQYRSLGADDVVRISGPEVDVPAAFANQANVPGMVVVGSGAELYPDVFQSVGIAFQGIDVAVAERIVRSRLLRRAAGEEVELGIEPLYLRRPDIHPAGGRKRATV